MVGCAGHPDCTSTLAEAMEHTMLPDELFCYEGHPNHLARVDSPCSSHPATTSGPRQVIVNLCKIQAEVRKGSNKAVKGKVNLPVIRIMGIAAERPIVPISLYSAMELATLIQGSGGVHNEMGHLPSYIRLLKSKVIDFKVVKI